MIVSIIVAKINHILNMKRECHLLFVPDLVCLNVFVYEARSDATQAPSLTGRQLGTCWVPIEAANAKTNGNNNT